MTVSVNDVDEAPIVTLTGFTPGGVDPIAHKNIPEIEDSVIEHAIHTEGVAPGIVYEITDIDTLNHILDRNDHGITPGSFAFDRNATHFTISKVAVTDSLSSPKYFVNVTDPTEDNIGVVTKYTLAQEQVLDDYLGTNANYEGIRAFSTTINADADPVDNLEAGEDIFFSLSGEHSNFFTIDNSTGEIFWNNPDVVINETSQADDGPGLNTEEMSEWEKKIESSSKENPVEEKPKEEEVKKKKGFFGRKKK